MVKVRMNTADVAAEVKCLRRLIGMRCANVYDVSPKTYLFKLVNSSGITESGESEKVLLLMESGIRLHTTAYVRDKSTTPSGFTLKLRKHIRTRRLEDVRQLGYDRIVLFQFGLGANAHYIILEMYAQGNILLTDADFMVMTLLRSHRDDEKGLAIMSRHHYPIDACRMFERMNPRKLEMALSSYKPPSPNYSSGTNEALDNASKGDKRSNQKRTPDPNKKAKDVGQASKCTLKTTLGEVLGYGPALSEHMILDAGLLPHMKIGVINDSKIDESVLQSLTEAVAKFEDWLTDIISGEKVPEGYILMQQKDSLRQGTVPSKETSQNKVYDEVCPILLNQFKTREFIKLDTFDAALDEFYSKIESQRLKQQQMAKEGSAMQKLEKIRSDQENRVHTLKKEVDHSIKMAQLIEYNLEDVDAAILAVRVALANGMDWVDLARMVKEEKKAGNPVAGLIDKLCLEKNCITLLLSNNLDEMDEEEKTSPVDKVEVDLSLSAHANARRWYDLKKKQEFKQEKTISAHEKAFKAAEKKTRLQLAQEKTVAAISHIRKVHWFEKFNWFITSENYLVISGRDAQQNEMIVKRYMSKGDLYIHADLHGASSTVIKNHKPENPVPPLSLNQAGCYTVCQSQAWNSKIVTSAWWVYPHQVSKTAPTGEYLTVGSFMVRGKKNFLPPHPLVMGFGILFRLDESSLALHLNERRVRGEDEGLHDMDEGENLRQQSDSGSGDLTSGAEGDDNSKNQTHGFSSNHAKLEVDDASIVSAPNNVQFMPSDLEPVFLSENHDGNNIDTLNADLATNSAYIHEKGEPSISRQLETLIDRALELGPTKGPGRRQGYETPTNVPSDTSLPTRLENHNYEERNDAIRDRPYISKAERRKLKKNQNSSDASAPSSKEKEKHDISDMYPEKNADNLRPSFSKITRGQKGKIKKIKENYAEQDDEERKIRMALLASAGKAAKKEKALNSKDESPLTYSKTTTGQDKSSKICYKCKKPGHLSKDCQEHIDEVEHTRMTANEDNRKEADMHAATDIDRVTIEEDDVHDIAEEEKGKLNDLDFLTGNPLPNDILLYAIPVCGPYNALQAYKYRVKITPGTAKKGKAAKTALSLFGHMPEATNREKELLKACTDSELVAAIIGNAKITAPGLTQLKQRQKKGKNQAKKNNTM